MASTCPENSMPRIGFFGRRRPVKARLMTSSALRRPASVRLTVVAWTLTRTSSSLDTGRSTSSSRRTSGGPYLSKTTALISFGVQDLDHVGARGPSPRKRGGDDRHDHARQRDGDQLPGSNDAVGGCRRVV